MGEPGEGSITLKTTVFSGDAGETSPRDLGQRTLKPGGFHQYSGLLGRLGIPAQGYVKVEKVAGNAPFYAYGVINDTFNSDGSFVFPLTESSLVGRSGQTLPVIIESAWIYGLQQNEENRSNLALVNTGEIDDSSSIFEITIYDGSGDRQPRTKSVTLGPRRWTQENGILGKFSLGYVQVTKTSGNNPFVTYGVINDGGRPGERSGDGAFLLSQE